jgi:hypothetical protein
MTPLRLAALFHDNYERLAPSFGYETRPETREFKPASPNGQLMIAVCQEILARLDCGHGETTTILADVPPEHRILVGRLAGVDYCLGPGSGQQIPLTLCLKCGRVQFKGRRHTPGVCQHCGSVRPFYLVPSNNDDICGTLEICLDCGQVQGQWPYPEETGA